MAWSNAKTAIAVGAGILIALAGTTVTVKEVQEHKTYSWQMTNADFGTLYKSPPQVVITRTKFGSMPEPKTFADSSRGIIGIDVPLANIVQGAYGKDKYRTVVTADLPAGKYDFFAKLATMPAQDTNWTTALQQEIRKKFGVTGQMEVIETNVLVLRPAATGVRGFKVSHTMPRGMAVRPSPGNYTFYEQPVSTLIHPLEQHFELPVVDQSGLTEEYDFSLTWDEPDPKNPNLDGLKQALHDQLGLDLVATNLPIEMLVVGSAK